MIGHIEESANDVKTPRVKLSSVKQNHHYSCHD